MVLNSLESADRMVKLYPLLSIAHRHLENLLGTTCHLQALGHSRSLQCLAHHIPAPPNLPQHILGRHSNIIKHHLTLLVLRHRRKHFADHTRAFILYQEQGDPILWIPPFPCSGNTYYPVSHMRVGHKQFSATDNIVILA